MSDTIYGIFPNIYSKEKFVSVLNGIKKQHQFEDDIYKVLNKYDGGVDIVDYTEDLVVRLLEVMYMDYYGLISSFIYDYNFCEDDEIVIVFSDKNGKYDKDYIDLNTLKEDLNDGAMQVRITNAEDLYLFLVEDMVEKLRGDVGVHNHNTDSASNNIEAFAKLYEAIYSKEERDVNDDKDSDKDDSV